MIRWNGIAISRGLLLALTVSILSAQEIPANLGGGLQELVQMHRARPVGAPELALRGKALGFDPATHMRKLVESPQRSLLVDRQNRVLVTIHLDGTASIDEMRQPLADLGIKIAAENPDYRNGALSVFLPLSAAEKLARLSGISTAILVHRPMQRVGAVTSQGTKVMHTDQVNSMGVTGQGITVGILSDSFNGNTTPPSAYDDVNTGDLPNVGVADGRPGLKFLSDGGDDIDNFTDEGRAMAQIVYDVAPGVSMCFATGALGPAAMASNIRRLRRDSGCFADVIVDDQGYFAEPWFSDGQIAQAINDVVTSTTLAGKQVAYFSAAGNDGGAGYASTLRFLSDTAARSLTGQAVDLSSISSQIDTSGGFHNFNPNPNGTPVISQSVTFNGIDPTVGLVIFMQWDDPFDLKNGVTTDLNLLVFDSKGKYLSSSTIPFADGFSQQEPIYLVGIPNDDTYRFVIVRTGTGTHQSTQVRWLAPSNGLVAVSGDYLGLTQPTVAEHSSAKNAISVGAYNYDNGLNSGQYTPELEPYSSAGPVILAFDSAGNRLSPYQILQKPDVAGPDFVSTTFFSKIYPDPNDDVYFAFPGTSAAAPHVAAVAALLLQNAGGPGSLTNEQIRAKLQESSTAQRDLDPFFSQANLTGGGATLNVSASGDYLDGSETGPSFFTVNFNSTTSGQTLTALTIDLTPTPQGLTFNPSSRTGTPFAVGRASTGINVTSTAPTSKSKTLNLTFSGFASGGSISFGIEPDCSLCSLAAYYQLNLVDSADLLAGTTVSATLSDGTKLTGTMVNKIGTGYNYADGFGMIDAVAALKAP